MQKLLVVFAITLLLPPIAISEEGQQDVAAPTAEAQDDKAPVQSKEPQQDVAELTTEARDDEAPAQEETKTLSGMSILGNEEAPKSLVIIPWKASEIGSDLSLSDTLDDRARPVDKEVFLRELNFYRIRAGN